MISIIHPSRGRPDKSYQTIRLWLQRAGEEVEVIVAVDKDDTNHQRYAQLFSGHTVICDNHRSAVEAVNNAANFTSGEIIIVVSDDSECPAGWVKTIESAAPEDNDFVMKVGDRIQRWLITMPIIGRKYFERFGYVYHPQYRHMFCDTHFTHVADALKKVVWRNDIVFPHNHYSKLKQRPDAINRRADATWNEGKKVYLSMLEKNLELSSDIDIMDLSHYGREHLLWLKKNWK